MKCNQNASPSVFEKNNFIKIIITNFNEIDDFTKILIDLNFAKMIDNERNDARHQTNTMKFIIIKMLFDINHIYWYNFESFFYVLIWFCVRREWNFCKNSKNRFSKSVLTRWYFDSFQNIVMIKKNNMHVDEFEYILKKFSTIFDFVKSLCKKIRNIFFLKNGTFFKKISSNSSEKL